MTADTGTASPVRPLAELHDELDELVTAELAKASIPGMGVGIVRGEDELVVTAGVTSVEHPVAVDSRTLFQIGSTTKTLTATAVMSLVEQRDLGLDSPVASYLPEFRVARSEESGLVTIRHLLTHAGGWSGDWFLLAEPDYGRDGALAKVVADMWRAPRLTGPGEAFSYSNAGFYVLGRVLEVATGQPYPDAVRRLVLDPVGMTSSFFYADEMITERVAVGHVPGDDGPKVHRPWTRPFYAWPAGALSSCVDDQLGWARFWLSGRTAGGDHVVGPETMRTMTEPQLPMDGDGAVGLAWMLRDEGGVRVVEHGGATNGYLSRFSMAPDERFAVVVLANSSTAAAANRRLERWAYERVLGVTAEQPAPSAVPVTPTEYAGRYGLGDDPPWTHELLVEDDGGLLLVPGNSTAATPPPNYRLALCGEDALVCVEPEAAEGLRGSFGRAPDGTIAWLRFGLRIYNRLPG